MVSPIDEDPTERWQQIYDFYAEFAGNPGWKFLKPMIQFAGEISATEEGRSSYPSTSLAALGISDTPGYSPDSPFFCISVDQDRQFKFQFWNSVGDLKSTHTCPAKEAIELFKIFVVGLDLARQEKEEARII